MSQKSFVPQAAKSVSQALMSDTSPGYREYNEAPSVTGIGNFFFAAAPIHPGRDRATPKTPFEVDGATQVWHSSARYAQFRAPAFPSSLPCRSRCRALAGLARAQTSDDIRPRALCTPPPKSFTRSPRTVHPANAATGITVWSASFAPGVHFETNSDLCATAYCAAGLRSTSRAIASTMSAGTPRRPVARGNFIVFVCPPRGGQVCCLQPGRLN